MLRLGAKVYGDIIFRNNCVVVTNSVVNKSFLEEGITITGISGKK